MSNLIDRQETLDALDLMCDVICPYSKKQRDVMCGACAMGSAFDVVRDQPSVRPEHLTGHWIRVGDGYTDYFKCSECGELSDYEDNFCCDCGADMREATP